MLVSYSCHHKRAQSWRLTQSKCIFLQRQSQQPGLADGAGSRCQQDCGPVQLPGTVFLLALSSVYGCTPSWLRAPPTVLKAPSVLSDPSPTASSVTARRGGSPAVRTRNDAGPSWRIWAGLPTSVSSTSSHLPCKVQTHRCWRLTLESLGRAILSATVKSTETFRKVSFPHPRVRHVGNPDPHDNANCYEEPNEGPWGHLDKAVTPQTRDLLKVTQLNGGGA